MRLFTLQKMVHNIIPNQMESTWILSHLWFKHHQLKRKMSGVFSSSLMAEEIRWIHQQHGLSAATLKSLLGTNRNQTTQSQRLGLIHSKGSRPQWRSSWAETTHGTGCLFTATADANGTGQGQRRVPRTLRADSTLPKDDHRLHRSTANNTAMPLGRWSFRRS